MAENREEILANFQGITAIDDVAEAIFHLDETNWDLLSAINRVMPQDGTSPKSVHNDTSHDIEMIDEDISVITPKLQNTEKNNTFAASSSSSDSSIASNFIDLSVKHEDNIFKLRLPAAATVNDLKKRLETMCGVPLCRQQLSGLGGSRATSTASMASLQLPSNAVVTLKAADETLADDEVAERLTTTYLLKVRHEGNEFSLSYPGTKTVQEVKNDVYALTEIPVRHQVWSGWPDVPGLDSTVLAMASLNLPEHVLTISRALPQLNNTADSNRIEIDSSDSEHSSVEEFEDAENNFPLEEEDMFTDDVRSERLQPLMPENVEDEVIGSIEFAERFRQRYGENTPTFFHGSLQEAIKESCSKPAAERRLLGVYLHHDGSVLTNVFCAQLLGCDAVLHTLQENFILYGWDLSLSSNTNTLLTAVRNTLGDVAAMTVQSIPVERLPAILIIMKVRSNVEIYSIINGNVGLSELVGSLMESVERFQSLRSADEKAEKEREARQMVKSEQDEAYRRSLEADRAKEEMKRQQEMEKNRELEKAENERVLEEARLESLKAYAASRVPIEPLGDTDCCRLRVRLPAPNCRVTERRFLPTDTLQNLLDYLASEGYPQDSYKVICGWPRRDLTQEDGSSTLKSLKLYPQETVMLEER